MYFYLCLNMVEVCRASENYEVQPLMYPSLLTVRFGTDWKHLFTYLNTSATEFKGKTWCTETRVVISELSKSHATCVFEGKGDRTVFCKCNGPAMSPKTSFWSSFRNKFVKISTPKTRCRAPVEMCRFDKASKTWKHHSLSLLFDSQEKVFYPGISQAMTHFKHALTYLSPISVRWWTHVKGCRSGKVTLSTQEWTGLLLAYTNKDVYMEWQVCVGEW